LEVGFMAIAGAGALAPDRVGSPSVASFALNAAAPLMVVGAYVTTAWAVTGAVPVSLALLGLGAVLAVWCGYVRMARHVVNAGSLYTYIAHGIGARFATVGAAVAIAATGWNPTTQLFFWLGTTGALGVLILMTAASVAVVGFFWTDRRGESRWASRIAPALAAGILGVCVLLVLDNYAALLGVAPTSSARWALPSVYLVAALTGAGYALVLGGRRPTVLRGIGRGANAAGSLMLEGVR
jgi:hypothetical protein